MWKKISGIGLLVILYVFLIYKIVSSYQENREMIERLQTPVEIAEVYMSNEYDGVWYEVDNVLSGTNSSGSFIYEVRAFVISDRIYTEYDKADSEITATLYRHIEDEEYGPMNTWIEISITDSFNTIWAVSNHSLKEQDTNEYYRFTITEQNGEYQITLGDGETIVPLEEVEEHLGVTVEEIVEIAELNRQGFDDIMYGMKELQLKRNKMSCIRWLIVIHVLVIANVACGVWNIFRKSRGEKQRKRRFKCG